jgi:UDP-N-acetylmuramoyl-L-alanyl-D-glutamate--2,6-diaminopimelate ligase
MGAVASLSADHVIVTDDNPRSEDPADIRNSVLSACINAVEIGDRKLAISKAIDNLKKNDVLVVAGKGHETGQIIGDKVLPFDDRKTVTKCIQGLAL